MEAYAYAPGKIIICGEHFVVYGATALAAAINRGTTAIAETSPTTTIYSKNLEMQADLSTNKIPEKLKPLAAAISSTKEYLNEKRGVKLTIQSNIPPRSGLGSSSSSAVATVAATALALGHKLSLDEVIELAMSAERLVHRSPSGVDVQVSARGGLLLFKKGAKPQTLTLSKNVSFVVACTGIERETSDLIERVKVWREENPSLFNSLVESSTVMSHCCADALCLSDLKRAGAILNFFHATLSWLGISIKEIDRIVEAALSSSAYGAKLTGAGGGGSVIILCSEDKVDNVVKEISSISSEAFATPLPNSGVKTWIQKS
ncbi:MAG: mevalonate kinase [Nitrososphaerales archaeon]